VLVIVQPPNDGQRLVVEVPCRDPYLNIQESKPDVDVRDVTPGLVRRFMDDARAMGGDQNRVPNSSVSNW
jgi:hypothetical protein